MRKKSENRLRKSADRFRACLVACAVSLSCGYVGDPQPPALRIPVPVGDLAALQRANRIVVRFSASGATLDGIPLPEFGAVDLRIGAEGARPFDRGVWETRAAQVPVPPPWKPGPFCVEFPASPWTGREVILGVRVANPGGRWSEWSDLFALHVVEPLKTPEGLQADSIAPGVRLRWMAGDTRTGLRYRIFRRPGKEGDFLPIAEAESSEWVDTAAEYGAPLEYRVQAIARTGDDVAESAVSEPVSITPLDRFGPAPPGGLVAAVGFDTVELTWDRSTEPDLAGYFVYRDGGFGEQRISDLLASPAYSDRDVHSGVHYRYRVRAVDREGNEGDPTPAVEQSAP